MKGAKKEILDKRRIERRTTPMLREYHTTRPHARCYWMKRFRNKKEYISDAKDIFVNSYHLFVDLCAVGAKVTAH